MDSNNSSIYNTHLSLFNCLSICLSVLQNQQEKTQMEIGNLKYENESLRNRLRDVVNSPLSDAEKHQIIQDSQRLHSSAPASIALPSVSENKQTIYTLSI